ncbi:MAG: lysophospholipid acyltransferase family protein [Muribaculaceae bacterium]|nr:lysophospholipid acyltransferase family protein [Muribaculaceae bacterium]
MDKQTIGYKLSVTALTGIAHIPLKALYLVSDIVCAILYHVIGYRRKVVRKNLTMAFPDASKAQISKWERQFYRHLGDVFVETVKLLHFTYKEVAKRIEVVNAHLVDDYYAQGKSTVLFLGHYCNWEWCSAITPHFHSKVKPSQIYHPVSNSLMDSVMLRIRSRFNSESIPMPTAVRRLLSIEKSGDKFVCGFIADQRPNGSVFEHWTDFLGIDTPYMVGAETIGNKIGAAYLYLDVEKVKRGYLKLTFKPVVPPEDDTEPYPVTRRYLAMLEESIRRAPQYWLWSHNRWKRKRKDAERHALKGK